MLSEAGTWEADTLTRASPGAPVLRTRSCLAMFHAIQNPPLLPTLLALQHSKADVRTPWCKHARAPAAAACSALQFAVAHVLHLLDLVPYVAPLHLLCTRVCGYLDPHGVAFERRQGRPPLLRLQRTQPPTTIRSRACHTRTAVYWCPTSSALIPLHCSHAAHSLGRWPFCGVPTVRLDRERVRICHTNPNPVTNSDLSRADAWQPTLLQGAISPSTCGSSWLQLFLPERNRWSKIILISIIETTPGGKTYTLAWQPLAQVDARSQRRAVRAQATKTPYPPPSRVINTEAPTDVEYDAVIVGGGMGGLATAAKLVAKGAKVVVLEK